MKKISVLFLFFFIIKSFAQTYSGEIFLRDNSSFYLNQVYVTNLNELKTVLSDYNGNFRINAKTGDVIRFTSIVTERKDVVVTDNMLQNDINFVELVIAYHDIQEVIISKFKPSGNLKKDVLALKTGQKAMKLKAIIGLPEPKGDGTSPELPVASLANGGLSFSVDSIYDILSGEKKKKERLKNYERMLVSTNNIKNYFGKDYFVKLKIPENLIDNFLQFIYSSDNLQPYITAKNYEPIQFFIEKYLPIYQRRLKNSNLMNINIK